MRGALGADAFNDAWRTGHDLTLDRAVTEALLDLELITADGHTDDTPP